MIENELHKLIKIHNKSQYVFTLWTEDCKFIDCNDAAIKFFGIKSKEEYRENISQFIPKIQPDDSETLEDAAKHLNKCSETETFYSEFMMQKPYNTEVPVYFALQKIKILDAVFIVSYHFLSTEKNAYQKEIAIRNKLIKALNEISEKALISSDINTVNVNEIMYELLKTIGSANEIDRCYIDENYCLGHSAMFFMRQIYKWTEESKTPKDVKMIDDIAYYPDIYNLLASGKVFNAISENLEEYSAGILADYQIKSILMIPLFIDNNFWGFLGLDDCKSAELWSDIEIEILRTASFIIVKMLGEFGKAKK